MSDKTDAYDEAVEYFWRNSDRVYDAWDQPFSHKYGYLFSFLSKNRKKYQYDTPSVNTKCGCPIQVHCSLGSTTNFELTETCRKSRILPDDVNENEDFSLKILQELARIQRLADTILEREPINAQLWAQQNKLGDN